MIVELTQGQINCLINLVEERMDEQEKSGDNALNGYWVRVKKKLKNPKTN